MAPNGLKSDVKIRGRGVREERRRPIASGLVKAGIPSGEAFLSPSELAPSQVGVIPFEEEEDGKETGESSSETDAGVKIPGATAECPSDNGVGAEGKMKSLLSLKRTRRGEEETEDDFKEDGLDTGNGVAAATEAEGAGGCDRGTTADEDETALSVTVEETAELSEALDVVTGAEEGTRGT